MLKAFWSEPLASADAGPYICPEIPGQPPNLSVAGRTETTTQSTLSTISLLVFGQSQAVNIAFDSTYTPPSRVDNFNFYNGKNYVAQDPLLGCRYDGGNFATRVAGKLILAGKAQRVVVTNCAIAATTSEQWMPGGIIGDRTRFVLRAMLQAGLRPDAILFQQGESDAAESVDATTRAARVRAIVAYLRQNGSSAPFFVAHSTVLPGEASPSQRSAVREGNRLSLSDSLGIFIGPDADAIGAGKRQSDGTHFTAAGIDQLASMWLAVLSGYF